MPGFESPFTIPIDAPDWWRRASANLCGIDAEFAQQQRALICWHHLYRWPAIRRAADAAYTHERYRFLMFIADHAGPEVMIEQLAA